MNSVLLAILRIHIETCQTDTTDGISIIHLVVFKEIFKGYTGHNNYELQAIRNIESNLIRPKWP